VSLSSGDLHLSTSLSSETFSFVAAGQLLRQFKSLRGRLTTDRGHRFICRMGGRVQLDSKLSRGSLGPVTSSVRVLNLRSRRLTNLDDRGLGLLLRFTELLNAHGPKSIQFLAVSPGLLGRVLRRRRQFLARNAATSACKA